MSRLPFDSQDADPPASPDDGPMTVTALAGRIKAVLTSGLPGKVRVTGEISNLSDRNHWFFSLKDEGATLRCVMFASSARRVSGAVRDGVKVVAVGRVDFYDAQGSVQLYVDRLEPVGQGDLEQQLRQLMHELSQLGYFDAQLKRPLPALPRTIAVVTSRSAAALQDVIDTASRRWPGCRLLLMDVRVQGASAAPQIARAIEQLSSHGRRLGVDAILLTRGGGSIEDLWAFNDRAVADAIYQCALPVVAAVGHETDTTIAELVADHRCATPTQAAMTLIPDAEALHHQVDQLQRRLAMLVQRQCEHAQHRVAAARRSRLLARPRHMLDPVAQRLDRLSQQLEQSASRRLIAGRQRLDALGRQLHAISPASVLHRGYSYTLDAKGQLVRHADQLQPGDALTTVLADSQVQSIVDPQGDHPPPSPTPRKRQRKRPSTCADQGGLFT